MRDLQRKQIEVGGGLKDIQTTPNLGICIDVQAVDTSAEFRAVALTRHITRRASLVYASQVVHGIVTPAGVAVFDAHIRPLIARLRAGFHRHICDILFQPRKCIFGSGTTSICGGLDSAAKVYE